MPADLGLQLQTVGCVWKADFYVESGACRFESICTYKSSAHPEISRDAANQGTTWIGMGTKPKIDSATNVRTAAKMVPAFTRF